MQLTRSRLETALYDEVQDLVAQALEVLAELLHSPDDKIRLRVAQTLLRTANPMKANIIQHIDEAPATPSSHLAKAMEALDPAEAEFDTIRHFSTHNPTAEKPRPVQVTRTPSRNQRCPCNSGIKYRKCCGNPARPAAAQAPAAA